MVTRGDRGIMIFAPKHGQAVDLDLKSVIPSIWANYDRSRLPNYANYHSHDNGMLTGGIIDHFDFVHVGSNMTTVFRGDTWSQAPTQLAYKPRKYLTISIVARRDDGRVFYQQDPPFSCMMMLDARKSMNFYPIPSKCHYQRGARWVRDFYHEFRIVDPPVGIASHFYKVSTGVSILPVSIYFIDPQWPLLCPIETLIFHQHGRSWIIDYVIVKAKDLYHPRKSVDWDIERYSQLKGNIRALQHTIENVIRNHSPDFDTIPANCW